MFKPLVSIKRICRTLRRVATDEYHATYPLTVTNQQENKGDVPEQVPDGVLVGVLRREAGLQGCLSLAWR